MTLHTFAKCYVGIKIFFLSQCCALNEAYAEVDYYELVHVLPVSVWREIKGQIGGRENHLFLKILIIPCLMV